MISTHSKSSLPEFKKENSIGFLIHEVARIMEYAKAWQVYRSDVEYADATPPRRKAAVT